MKHSLSALLFGMYALFHAKLSRLKAGSATPSVLIVSYARSLGGFCNRIHQDNGSDP